jgi:peptidoglycan/LPS O-acetylase OafA/YrhL
MNAAFSSHLNAMRAFAAFIVLLSHWAYERFTDGDYIVLRQLNLGSDAVVVFFVLSGFIIAYTAEKKDKTIAQFAFNRATRIYSVALPALLLTQIFDFLGQRIDPAAYDGWWLSSAGLGQQILTALTFTTEIWFKHTRIGTNGPYWSLAYEVWYYIVFACMFYLRGRDRIVWTSAAVLLMGPNILLLAPSWWLGVWVYRVAATGPSLSRLGGWSMSLTPIMAYAAMQALELPSRMLAATKLTLGDAFVIYGLGFSDEFVWNAIIGVLVAIHLLGVATLVHKASRPETRLDISIKWLAGASFSMYLVHYPTLQLSNALMPSFGVPQLRHALMLGLTVCVCFGFAWMFERRLALWRRLLIGLIGPIRATGAAVMKS